jgi:hypothetical protein
MNRVVLALLFLTAVKGALFDGSSERASTSYSRDEAELLFPTMTSPVTDTSRSSTATTVGGFQSIDSPMPVLHDKAAVTPTPLPRNMRKRTRASADYLAVSAPNSKAPCHEGSAKNEIPTLEANASPFTGEDLFDDDIRSLYSELVSSIYEDVKKETDFGRFVESPELESYLFGGHGVIGLDNEEKLRLECLEEDEYSEDGDFLEWITPSDELLASSTKQMHQSPIEDGAKASALREDDILEETFFSVSELEKDPAAL